MSDLSGCLGFLFQILDLHPNKGSKQAADEDMPYVAKPCFFTKDEQRFYELLAASLSSTSTILLSKVRLWDLIDVPRGTEGKGAFTNRIRAKHIDFVLLKRSSGKVILAIELDGKSHDNKKQKERDDFKDAALAAAGVPLLRIRSQRDYDRDQIIHLIKQAIAS